jgi:meckelin
MVHDPTGADPNIGHIWNRLIIGCTARNRHRGKNLLDKLLEGEGGAVSSSEREYRITVLYNRTHRTIGRVQGMLLVPSLVTAWALALAPAFVKGQSDPVVEGVICSSGEYLDVSSLSCKNCVDDSDGSGRNEYKVPDFDRVDSSGNALGCKCTPGYVEELATCSTDAVRSGSCVGFRCTACSSLNAGSSLDASSCISCGNSTTGVSADGLGWDCQCPSLALTGLMVLSEVDEGGAFLSEKRCDQCAPGTRVIAEATSVSGVLYEGDRYTCQACPSEHMSFARDGSCACDTGYTQVGVEELGPPMCLESWRVNEVNVWQTASSHIVTYSPAGTGGTTGETVRVTSLTMENMFQRAGAQCYAYTGPSDLVACQALGNLCVMQHYDPLTDVCKLFNEILGKRQGSNVDTAGWGETLPWLQYGADADTVRGGSGPEMKLSFRSTLEFMLAKYSLDGDFLGFEDMGTQPFYCEMQPPRTADGGGKSRSTKWLKFGTGYSEQYSCDLSTLLGTEQYFYDPYLLDTATGELFPVPVLNTNLKSTSSNRLPNENAGAADEEDDKFTRRFFWYDVASGLDGDSLSPSFIRYASDIRLTVQLDSSERIHPPILEITYVDVDPLTWDATPSLQTPTVSFHVDYTMDTSNFWGILQPFFAVAMVLVGLAVLWRLRNWSVRTTRKDVAVPQVQVVTYLTIDWPMVFQGALLAAHTFVLVMFPFTFALCGYWFVFFKLQESAYLLMPSDRYGAGGDYGPIMLMINLLFFCQLVHVLHAIWQQCNTDVFLLDWEKGSKGGSSSHVSVWRRIMVANEWNELQTVRRTSISFTLLWLSYLLVGLGLEYNATTQPNLKDKEPDELNPVLRYANTTFWWMLLSALQFLWKWVVYERYLAEPPWQRFVDFATIAKVSVFFLDEKYHGWYLHCRSPYPQADVPMSEIAEQLNKEESGLTTDRGLEGCPPDLQTFELFVSGTWKMKYDKIQGGHMMSHGAGNGPQRGWGWGWGRRPLPTWSKAPPGGTGLLQRQGSQGNGQGQRSHHRGDWGAQLERDMTAFLQGFIEQNFTRVELQRVYREVSSMDQLIGTPPDSLQQEKSPCILYPDRAYHFMRTTFMGIEVDLLLLDISAFAAFDLWFSNTSASILLTYLLFMGLASIRTSCGEANLARRTLIDQRFLI